ncbi:MAG: hypothetical protein AAGD96_25625, partial [Chloroflexota bacterium]
MSKKLLNMGAVLLLGGLWATFLINDSPASAQSGGWVSKSAHAPYRIDRVCQDGYQVTVVNRTTSGNSLDFDDSVTLNPAIWVNEDLSDVWRDTADNLVFDYYPRVGSKATFVVGAADLQDTPVMLFGNEEFHYRTEMVPLGQPLQVGEIVAVGIFSALIDNVQTSVTFPVEDCQFYEYASDEFAVFTPERLMPYASAVYSDSIALEILNGPISGVVDSNGVELQTGDQISLNDIHQNNLIYRPDETTESADALTYRVSGTVRVSLDDNGAEFTERDSSQPSISADGSKIAFVNDSYFDSASSTVIYSDVLVRDYEVDSLFNTSNNFGGEDANGDSYYPSISPDGRLVTFVSEASDILETDSRCGGIADTNNFPDVYVRDIKIPFEVYRASVFNFDMNSSNCSQIEQGQLFPPSMADIRANTSNEVDVAMATTADFPAEVYAFDNGASDIFLHNGSFTASIYTNQTGIFTGGAPNDRSLEPKYAADGSAVVFTTYATNLLPN